MTAERLPHLEGLGVLKQIILLPKKDYWGWVRACKDFVLTFGVSMTSDPASAVSHMSPYQVVSVVDAGDAYPEFGDIVEWMKYRNPDVRFDRILALTPAELEMLLGRRIGEGDQFGDGQVPISLAWPTEFPVITQSFGSNPQIYGAYGFPGHEGVDFWALMGSKVFCCMDGEVYKVHEEPSIHPYGIHICILHRGGYRTIYGHLLRANVVVGQQVKAGEVIGLVDTTGSSNGNHLHLSLRHDGATERMETDYTKDVIDPTPYLVWPDTAIQKSLPEIDWPAGKCLIGAHGRVGAALEQEDIDVVRTARLEAVKISLHESGETISQLRAINPGMLLVARIDGASWHAPIDADAFIASVGGDVARLYLLGIRQFEVLANPNLVGKGWGRCWRDGRDFGAWYLQVVRRLREKHPKARFGFPGLSPGGTLIGQRMSADDFICGAAEAAAEADWIGVNCHWTDSTGMRASEGGLAFELYQARFPGRLAMITEFSNPAAGIGDHLKAQQYLDFLQGLRNRAGIGAAFAYSISAVVGHETVAWRKGVGCAGVIAEAIGSRGF